MRPYHADDITDVKRVIDGAGAILITFALAPVLGLVSRVGCHRRRLSARVLAAAAGKAWASLQVV